MLHPKLVMAAVLLLGLNSLAAGTNKERSFTELPPCAQPNLQPGLGADD